MRGPGVRLDLDVRRIWKCSHCGQERKTTGNVAALLCRCSGTDGVWMSLVERPKPPRVKREPAPPIPEYETPERDDDSSGEHRSETESHQSAAASDRPRGPNRSRSGTSGEAPDGSTDAGAPAGRGRGPRDRGPREHPRRDASLEQPQGPAAEQPAENSAVSSDSPSDSAAPPTPQPTDQGEGDAPLGETEFS